MVPEMVTVEVLGCQEVQEETEILEVVLEAELGEELVVVKVAENIVKNKGIKLWQSQQEVFLVGMGVGEALEPIVVVADVVPLAELEDKTKDRSSSGRGLDFHIFIS